jgi:hypothetical protein
MKAKLPRSVRFDSEIEERLVKLLSVSSKLGMKFPDVLNFAISRLLDDLDKGAKIMFDENGPNLVWVQMPDEDRVQSAPPFGAKTARKR